MSSNANPYVLGALRALAQVGARVGAAVLVSAAEGVADAIDGIAEDTATDLRNRADRVRRKVEKQRRERAGKERDSW